MSELKQDFTDRQYMISPDFEIYHYKDQPTLEIDFHNHDFYEIYYLISGKVNYMVEGKCYSLKHDDILIINNKELHRPEIQKGAIYERIVLWVNPEFIRKLGDGQSNLQLCFEQPSRNHNNVLRPDDDTLAIIKNNLYKLSKNKTSSLYASDILNKVYLTELIIQINRAYLDVHGEDSLADEDYISNPKINEVIRYINHHLDEELSLESLSARLFISKYHLIRQFKKYTGFTLYNYVQRKRLIQAKLLLKKDLKLTEICQLCGFKDYSNFLRSFKAAYHISPKKYSKINK